MMGDWEDEREGLVVVGVRAVVGGLDGTLSAVVPGHKASRTCDIISDPNLGVYRQPIGTHK